MSGKDAGKQSTVPKSASRRRAIRAMGATSVGLLSSTALVGEWTDVSQATPKVCTSDVDTSCGGGGGYPIQNYSYDDESNGDLVSGVSEFDAYGSENVDNWKIPLEVSSNASRPFCNCGTSDEINWSSITFTWDSTEGGVFVRETDNYIGASHEQRSESDFNYEDYAQTAVDYGIGRLLDLVPYAGELKAGGEILYAMYHDAFVEENTTETWQTKFDWNNVTYEINQVSYWNKIEAVLDPGTSMTFDITDETDSDKISGHALQNSFSWKVNAPSDSPSSSTVLASGQADGWSYTSVDREIVSANLEAYGLTQSQLERLPGDTITFARQANRS